jgi:outer membrane lipoprotein-sorting protein
MEKGMSKLLSLICAGSLLCANTFGQGSDKQSQEILKGVSHKYKTYNTIKTTFSFVVENPRTKTVEKQTGTLYLKGDKYRLEIAGQEIVSDNKTVWTYLKESNEVQINDPNANKDAIAPNNIFTMYEKGFHSKFVEETKENGKVEQIIELTPIDKSKHYFKIRLAIDKNEKLISSSKIFDKNGNKSTYTIEKFQPNPPLPEEMFTFNKAKYPGVEVLDLR